MNVYYFYNTTVLLRILLITKERRNNIMKLIVRANNNISMESYIDAFNKTKIELVEIDEENNKIIRIIDMMYSDTIIADQFIEYFNNLLKNDDIKSMDIDDIKKYMCSEYIMKYHSTSITKFYINGFEEMHKSSTINRIVNHPDFESGLCCYSNSPQILSSDIELFIGNDNHIHITGVNKADIMHSFPAINSMMDDGRLNLSYNSLTDYQSAIEITVKNERDTEFKFGTKFKTVLTFKFVPKLPKIIDNNKRNFF